MGVDSGQRLDPTTGYIGNEKMLVFLASLLGSLSSDLELASLGHVFYALERFVLLPIHVQAIYLQPRDSQLLNFKLKVDGGILIRFGCASLKAHSSLQTRQLLGVYFPYIP